jgi:hypothetical protein
MNNMSHQAKITTNIKIRNRSLHRETLELLCRMHGGRIVDNVTDMKGFGGQRWPVKGTVLSGLRVASYHTDVDFYVNDEGVLEVNGDAHGQENMVREYQRAYDMVVEKRNLKAMGCRVRLTMNVETQEYVLVGEEQ